MNFSINQGYKSKFQEKEGGTSIKLNKFYHDYTLGWYFPDPLYTVRLGRK